MPDVGPPIAVVAVGLILWLAVKATVAGISIQTIGLIVFLAGLAWLAISLAMTRRTTVARRREPVVVERDVY